MIKTLSSLLLGALLCSFPVHVQADAVPALVEKTSVKYRPGPGAKTLCELPAGTRVEILNYDQKSSPEWKRGWINVVSPGCSGWMHKTDATRCDNSRTTLSKGIMRKYGQNCLGDSLKKINERSPVQTSIFRQIGAALAGPMEVTQGGGSMAAGGGIRGFSDEERLAAGSNDAAKNYRQLDYIEQVNASPKDLAAIEEIAKRARQE